MRIVAYEGAIAAGIFENLKQTSCRSFLTCCGKIPDKNIWIVPDEDEEGDGADEEANQTQLPLTKSKKLGNPAAHDNDTTAFND